MAISDELRKLVDPNNECCCEHCLSNKCKEWASEEEYLLLEFGKCVYLIPDDFDDDELCFSDYNCFSEKIISETIFKAAQWILDNKDEK